MTIVHQAIYGDKVGSYALLKTSLVNTEHAKRICNVTDLLDRPSNGFLTQPVIRGFAVYDSYIFIKSFPDNTSTVRMGRVFSHTLIVDQNDLNELNDLGDLFSHFLSDPNKDYELRPIILKENLVSTKIANQVSREAAAINGLLHHSSYNNTVVWIGEEGYLSFITQIWRQIEGNIRAKLKLGIGFNPQKINLQSLNILYVIEEYENKWQNSDYCIVAKETIESLETMSSFLLAGHKDKSKPLCNMIESFGIALSEIEDLSYLEKVVVTYNNLTSTDFNRLIILCDLISKYSPDQKIANVEKDRLLNQVILRFKLASPKQILVLKNAEWKGFSNGQQLIGDHITDWVVKSLFDSKVDTSITNVITAAFDPRNRAQWWKKAFLDGLSTALEKWKSSFALFVWNCFTEDHDLVKTFGNLIPVTTKVETDLVNHWMKPKNELAQNIRVFAEDRKWLILHGLATLQLHSPEESIISQLKIDTDPEYSAALNRMAESIKDKDFIQLTVKIREIRLIKIAGKKVANNPSLLVLLDVQNIIWREIWLEAMVKGLVLWEGIKKPIDILFTLFDGILNGEMIQPELLSKVSNSNYNDLSELKQRSKVWDYLNGDTKDRFLSASTLGCVKLLDTKNIQINNFEGVIRNKLSETFVIRQVTENRTISISTKIQLFEEISELKEHSFLELLKTLRFSPGESERIGKLIFRNKWKKAMDFIVHEIDKRGDLKLALIECKSLLGFFDRLNLSFKGYLYDSVSTEDWWDAYTIQCYTKYPKGPTDKGLWERSDGKNYDLLTKGTGREIWVDIINKIRIGRIDVNIMKLLQEMLNDYHYSNELEQLKRTYK